MAYVNSFVTVFLLWNAHHGIFRMVNRTDHRMMLANGLSLFLVSAVSYPTSVLGKYLLTDAAASAAAFYAGYCAMINAAFIVLWLSASGQNGKLLRVDVSRDVVRKTLRVLMVPLPFYALAILLAFFSSWISVGLITALWIYWAATLKDED